MYLPGSLIRWVRHGEAHAKLSLTSFVFIYKKLKRMCFSSSSSFLAGGWVLFKKRMVQNDVKNYGKSPFSCNKLVQMVGY